MPLPPIKYFFQPKRWRYFIISQMKKYLTKHGEMNPSLTKVEMFEVTRRVVNSYDCFEQGYCKKCKCNMVDAINTKTYSCSEGCFGPMLTEELYSEYNKLFKNEFKNITTKRQNENT